jgi:molybdenum cofactor guanylyltransferase
VVVDTPPSYGASVARCAAPPPLGVVLAGGAARRAGGDKMRAPYRGRPLVCWAVDALAAVLPEVVVVAKAATRLPALAVAVWVEPDAPRHPLAGVAHALERAGGQAVLVCAGDVPEPPPALLARLAADRSAAPAVVPRHPGGAEPLVALYRPAARAHLLAAARAGAPARRVVEELGARWVDAAPLANLNAPPPPGSR